MLRDGAAQLSGRVSHPLLLPLLARLNGDSDAATLDSVLAFIAQRPPRAWSDADADAFAGAATPLGTAFRDAFNAQNLVQSPGVAASEPRLEAALSVEESEVARKISQRLEKQLVAKDGAPLPRHVQRAALQALLQKLNDATSI